MDRERVFVLSLPDGIRKPRVVRVGDDGSGVYPPVQDDRGLWWVANRDIHGNWFRMPYVG